MGVGEDVLTTTIDAIIIGVAIVDSILFVATVDAIRGGLTMEWCRVNGFGDVGRV